MNGRYMPEAEATIGSVLFPFVGDSLGGSHVSALTLIDALPALGIQPVVGLHQTDGLLAAHLESRGTPFETLPPDDVVIGGPLPIELYFMQRASVRLAPMLRNRSWRFIHTNDARMHMTWTLAARRAGCAHVWHQRTINPSRRLGLYSWFPARVLTISEFCRSGLPAAMAARARVVDEPFDLPEMSNDVRAGHRHRLVQELSIPPDAAIVGFVGNMEAQKRPELFLKIAALHTQRAGNNCHFVMIGDTRGFLTIERQAELQRENLAGRVHLPGPCFPILPYMAGFDVLVAPGVGEGLGRTVIEAMLLSTAVIAADDGGHHDIVAHRKTGLLAGPDDAGDFADQLSMLLGDRELRTKLAEAGRTATHQRYDAHRHAAILADIYGELASDIRH
jgi:glycosyltransferase involved in cell wall biosynthesis